MSEFRCGHASAPDWAAAARSCLVQLGAPVAGATLGFVYVTDAFAADVTRIIDYLRVGSGVRHWVGTVGIGVCGPDTEYFQEPAMSLLVGDFPLGSFRVVPVVDPDLAGFEAAHGDWCRQSGARFGVVHGDPREPGIATRVAQLAHRMEAGYLVGGLASSAGDYAHVADGLTTSALSGVLFGDAVPVSTRLTQSCSPIGPRREITAASANVIFELDGRPALDVFLDDAGDAVSRDPVRLAAEVLVGLPLKGSDTGDYLVRNLVGIDADEKCLAIAESVDAGEALFFCRRDPEAAATDMRRMLGEIRSSVAGRPRGGVYHTCLARGPNLFGAPGRELAIIREELGDFPLAGFFANGEIAHDHLYGYTGVLTVFG